jgi:hypothetical protein
LLDGVQIRSYDDHELVDVLVGGDEHINNAAVQKFSQVYEDAQETFILCHLLLESFENFQIFLCQNGVKKNSGSTCLLPHQSWTVRKISSRFLC